MRKFLFLILISSTLFADVYLKTNYDKKNISTTTLNSSNITNLCSDEHESWSNIYNECVCDVGYKKSPNGCIIDPCYNYDCGNGGSCKSRLIKENTVPISRKFNYHYEASCTCPENYVEFNLQCIENPCLNYKCYDYGYCEAVEDECKCKEGYAEYTGNYLFNEDNNSYLANTTLTCVPTRKVWNWTSSDKECKPQIVTNNNNSTKNIRYAVYLSGVPDTDINKCSNGIRNCRCINSPFTSSNPGVSNLGGSELYKKNEGWILLYKDMGFPMVDESRVDEPGWYSVDIPKFIIYNKYTGELKTFIYVRNPLETFTYGFIENYFLNYRNKTMLFNNTFDKSLTEGHYNYLNQDSTDIVGNLKSTTIIPNLPGTTNSSFWVYSNLNTYYDSKTSQIENSSLLFNLKGVDETISTGELIGQIEERIDNGSVNDNSLLQKAKNLYSTFKTAKSYYNDTKSMAESIIKSSKNKNGIIGTTINYLESIGLNISSDLSIIGKTVPYIGAAFAFLDYFTGASSSKKEPSIFDAKLKINLNSIRHSNIISFSIKTPGTLSNNSNSFYLPYYDKPLGVFTLSSPFILRKQLYDSTYKACQDELEGEDCMANESEEEYYYSLLQLPKIIINPNSELVLDKAYVSIVSELDLLNDEEAINWDNNGIGRGFVNKLTVEELKDHSNVITNKIAKYSTVILPYDFAKYNLSINVPKKSNVFVKLILILKTKKSGTESNKKFIFVKTFIPDFEEASILNKYYPQISIYQKKSIYPIGNVQLINENGTQKFKRGEVVTLKYSKVKKSMNNNLYSLFPTSKIRIDGKEVNFIEGDNYSAWSWNKFSSVSKYDLYENLEPDVCDDINSFNCLIKKVLENNQDQNNTLYEVKRKFIIPTNLNIGINTLIIPISYYTYSSYKENNITKYKQVLHHFIFEKKIEIVE